MSWLIKSLLKYLYHIFFDTFTESFQYLLNIFLVSFLNILWWYLFSTLRDSSVNIFFYYFLISFLRPVWYQTNTFLTPFTHFYNVFHYLSDILLTLNTLASSLPFSISLSYYLLESFQYFYNIFLVFFLNIFSAIPFFTSQS